MKCTRTENIDGGFSITFTIDAHDIKTAATQDCLDRRLLDTCVDSENVSGIALGMHTMALLIEKGFDVREGWDNPYPDPLADILKARDELLKDVIESPSPATVRHEMKTYMHEIKICPYGDLTPTYVDLTTPRKH